MCGCVQYLKHHPYNNTIKNVWEIIEVIEVTEVIADSRGIRICGISQKCRTRIIAHNDEKHRLLTKTAQNKLLHTRNLLKEE